jgi:hypothetical protein
MRTFLFLYKSLNRSVYSMCGSSYAYLYLPTVTKAKLSLCRSVVSCHALSCRVLSFGCRCHVVSAPIDYGVYDGTTHHSPWGLVVEFGRMHDSLSFSYIVRIWNAKTETVG